MFRKFSIFKDLTREQIEKVARLFSYRKYSEGEIIFKEGDRGDSLFILLEGEVEITKALTLMLRRSDLDTREKSFIRLNSDSHSFFGEMVFFEDNHERSATVKATKKCSMAVLKKDDFLRIGEEDPVIGFKLVKNIATVLADRLRKTNRDVLKLTTAFSLAMER